MKLTSKEKFPPNTELDQTYLARGPPFRFSRGEGVAEAAAESAVIRSAALEDRGVRSSRERWLALAMRPFDLAGTRCS